MLFAICFDGPIGIMQNLTSQKVLIKIKYFMVGFLTCLSTFFFTNGLTTHEFEDLHAMLGVPNRTFKQTNLIKNTADTEGSK
jgi:hypothetical protein